MNLYSTKMQQFSWIRDAKISDYLLIFLLNSANFEISFKIML